MSLSPIGSSGMGERIRFVGTIGYETGQTIDELKNHKIPGTDVSCKIRRGNVVAVYNQGKSAAIRCVCRAIVKEGV